MQVYLVARYACNKETSILEWQTKKEEESEEDQVLEECELLRQDARVRT
jgi:hypothetical protein